MREAISKSNAMARWREALLAEADLRVGALAEHYLGKPVKGQDREALVSGLSVFLSSEELKLSVPGLLDRADALIVGLLLASGGLPPEELGRLLSADMPYHELEYRLASLQERLIVFRARTGEYETAPQLSSSLARIVDAGTLFGPEENIDPGQRELVRPRLSIQELCFVAWALLREGPDPLLKKGGLSARAKKRILDLSGGEIEALDILAAVLDAFTRLGLAAAGDGGWAVDQRALSRLLVSAGDELPYILAAALAGCSPSAGGSSLKATFEPFLAKRFVFSAAGLARFVALAVLGGSFSSPEKGNEAAALKEALLVLGIISPVQDGAKDKFVCVPERAKIRWTAFQAGRGGTKIAVDGSGGIQVLPPSSTNDLVFLIETASLVSASGGWRFRLGRESARKAFAGGWAVSEIAGELEKMSCQTLPQTLSWDLGTWRAAYDSVRLFKGQTLVLSESVTDLVEKSGAFDKVPHEVLGRGFYFFGATHAKVIEEALLTVGLPPPSLRGGLAAGGQGGGIRRREEAHAGEDTSRLAAGSSSKTQSSGRLGGIALSFEVRPRIENPEPGLREELERLVPEPAARRGYEEMLDRRLVYTRNQLRAMVERDKIISRRQGWRGSVGAETLSAGGLDFNGKLRIIQAAFKAKYSRLDAKWVSGGQSLQALVRPVSLRKTEKDYELEGENLSTGRPVTIRVGSLTYISLKKGYYLGEK
ncbi:MAG: helicase-associated domain-containing protein [Spirochaetes bacterium]|nr:helicase-associated domain-containing protein [Spirochaetota bacterium]